MRCQIRWVCNDRLCKEDRHKHLDEGIMGRSTPDENPAWGYAITLSKDPEAFPICESHYLESPHEGWTYLRADVEAEVLLDKLAEIRVVCTAIDNAWPDQSRYILLKLRDGSDHYSFNRWGMYVGVEHDGYIHT